MNNKQPTRSNDVVLHQILKLIPRGMVGRIARETGVDARAGSFSAPSHLAAMLFAQLTHAIGPNDVCDWLRMKAAAPACLAWTAKKRRLGVAATWAASWLAGRASRCLPGKSIGWSGLVTTGSSA